MPHALTQRQKEYLNFIRNYIRDNEMTPRLDEIAGYFGVTLPTAHNILEALQLKGYVYFQRSREAGFFIRLVERAGSLEVVMHVPISGRINGFGELYDFPEDLGGFDDIIIGGTPYSVFALALMEDIPQENLQGNSLVVFDSSKRPQSGDICIGPIGDRLFLIKIASKTIDSEILSVETAIRYPIPGELADPVSNQLINWYPLAYNDANKVFFEGIAEEQNWPIGPIYPDFIIATALHQWVAL